MIVLFTVWIAAGCLGNTQAGRGLLQWQKWQQMWPIAGYIMQNLRHGRRKIASCHVRCPGSLNKPELQNSPVCATQTGTLNVVKSPETHARKPPEHPFPEPLEDVWKSYEAQYSCYMFKHNVCAYVQMHFAGAHACPKDCMPSFIRVPEALRGHGDEQQIYVGGDPLPQSPSRFGIQSCHWHDLWPAITNERRQGI